MRRGREIFLSVTGLLFACTLGGCSATSSYKKPDVAPPSEYRGAPAPKFGAEADTLTALLPSSRFFTDPALRSLIERALENNIDLQIALKNIDYAHETLNAAGLGELPSLNLVVQDTRTHPSDNGVKTNIQDRSAALTTSWEVDIWGKIRSRNKSALASYLKMQEAARAVRTRLVADVAAGYYNLVMLDAQLEISKKSLALADTTLKMIRLQFDAGQVTGLAVQQQQASRQSIALSIPLLEQKIALQENALGILYGRMPGSVTRNPSLLNLKVSDNFSTGVPAELLQNRPDVRAAEMAVRFAHADMGEAKAGLYPTFTVTATGSFEAFRASKWFNAPGSIFGLVQGAVVQPLFQRGQLKAKYEQSKIRREQSELEFRQAVLKGVVEVSDALVRLEKIKAQELIAVERVATLQSAASNSDLLFRSGMATYLEVIVTQTNALQAELTLADIRRQHLEGMAELYRSLGGGWR